MPQMECHLARIKLTVHSNLALAAIHEKVVRGNGLLRGLGELVRLGFRPVGLRSSTLGSLRRPLETTLLR